MTNQFKVGVLYCKDGQSTEEEMYNNRKLNHMVNQGREKTLNQKKGYNLLLNRNFLESAVTFMWKLLSL